MIGRRRIPGGLFALASMAVLAAGGEPLATGVLLPKVQCLNSPDHSYALYLPSAYRGDRPWPVLFAFSPNARGEDPVRLFQQAAERLGFIVVGSNDSKNGPIAPALKAQDALWEDVHDRFKVDPRRSYATGFSGGSRMALRMALKHAKAFAGVISIGAFTAKEMGLTGSRHLDFALLAGVEDFNHWEMLAAREELARNGNAVWADRFPGPHAWPPAAQCGQALAFLQLEAERRAGTKPTPGLEASFLAGLVEAARAAEGAGEGLLALRRWQEVARHFPQSPEGLEAAKSAARLDRDPAVKKEAELEARYGRLHDETTALQRMPGYTAELVKLKASTLLPGPEARFARLVLANETAMYWELGSQALDAKAWKRAAEAFETIARLDDGAPGPCYYAACARAQLGETARALDLLQSARSRGFRNVKALKEGRLLRDLQANPDFLALVHDMETEAPKP